MVFSNSMFPKSNLYLDLFQIKIKTFLSFFFTLSLLPENE